MNHIEKLKRKLSQAQETTKQIELELQKAEAKPTPEERLLELLKSCVIKYDFDKYPGRLFWLDDEGAVMEQDSKNDNLWVHYDRIWSVLKSEFVLNYNEIRELIKGLAEKHFNLKAGTPVFAEAWRRVWWRNISILRQEHLSPS